jgi:hypothetical protein
MIENIGSWAPIGMVALTAAGFWFARRRDRDELIRKDAALEIAAQNALQEAAEAKQEADLARQNIIVLKEAFHLYQLQQAAAMSKVVTTEGMSHIETRIMDAIRDLGRRIDGIADTRN